MDQQPYWAQQIYSRGDRVFVENVPLTNQRLGREGKVAGITNNDLGRVNYIVEFPDGTQKVSLLEQLTRVPDIVFGIFVGKLA